MAGLEHRPKEGQIFARRELAFQGIGMAHIMGLLGERPGRRGVSESAPPVSGNRPARTRKSVDFPAPFGPVTVRLSARF